MAKAPTMAATGTDGKPKRKPARGPQTRRFYFFLKVLDAAGNPIEGATIAVDRVMSDARKVLEFADSPEAAGLKRVKYEYTTKVRSDGTEEAGEGSAEVG